MEQTRDLPECVNCKWFFEATFEGWGECRRLPPLLSTEFIEGDDGSQERIQIGVWPSIKRSEFCGEYTRAPS